MQEYYKVRFLDGYCNLDRNQAEKELQGKDVGSYLIRDSSYEKPFGEQGYYFVISYVHESKKIGHKLIYIPHDDQVIILFKMQPPKINKTAIVVTDIDEYLKKNSSQFNNPIVISPSTTDTPQF